MKNYALIFAGGSGTRMHSRSVPKQFLKLYGKEIIVYTLENFQKHKMIDGIVVACKKDRISFLKQLVQDYGLTKVRAIVNGGKTSGESIFNALSELKKTEQEPSVVLINDGVRPLISQELITECIKCTVKNGNAIACSPATETILREEKNRVTEILDRSLCTS